MDDGAIERMRKMRNECIKFETRRARWLRSSYRAGWVSAGKDITDLPDDDDDDERESQ